MTAIEVRPFTASDFPACLAITNASDPAHVVGLAEAARDDAAWNADRYHRSRYVAVAEGGLVGWGEISHAPWQFHPDKYGLRLAVEPAHRRRGVGSLLLNRLLAELGQRRALLLRAVAFEDDAASIGFLTHRGFREVWRNLEARLDLAAFEPARYATAAERVARQGVVITTLPAELASGAAVLRELYDLYAISEQGQPQLDPTTMPLFDEFVAEVIHDPNTVPESWFLARVDGRLAGLSMLEHVKGSSDMLAAGYTAVHPDYRGRGIAMALKLRTIAFARDRGYRYIKTDSNAVNVRMIGINAALGFQPQPAAITFELRLQ